jgi:hypothetical protein
MPIYIDSTELGRILSRMPAAQNIMLTGRHGIGKSQILTRYFEAKGMKVVTLFLGQMSDPGDLIGLPTKNTETGKTDFMPPYWFPTDGKPVVLFLDELNRARPEVLQTIMDLALNRKLAGRSLPEGSRLISAVNDGEEYQLTDLDPALVSRFNVYAFRPSVQDWLLWAEKAGLDKRVTGFISAHQEWLDGDAGKETELDTGLEKTPDRRAWTKVSDALAGMESPDETDYKVISGIVGVRAASAFAAYLSKSSVPGAEDVLLRFAKVKDKLAGLEVHQLAGINESIFRYLEITDLDTRKRKTAGKNLCSYVDLVGARKEALAHFASLFNEGKQKKAVAFIVMDAAPVFTRMTQFINGL